ncbi:hypothetical protein A3B64_03900 [candidate division WWE3 bacterium RIFCSPLOWO2_01_FULL_37_24]|nr:MAG: hypothetical protein A2793_02650 [candidate division WWE3 bacterium RIFCSPHIGHO2_01_FULL_38_45]OGC52640.1 MAG: hypothetical protein A3B64_03900 [candidate division WWE3 bacterium RIFCSPLOWO2_01_FULL_37_24]HLB51472.1 carbohydrate kinase family protein [Patescibacteria group bacterium]
MKPDLLTIGDVSIDLYMLVDGKDIVTDNSAAPKICFYHGSKVQVEKFSTSAAGNACHVAVGCRLLGMNTSIYTELGDDQNADRFIEEFEQYGIETKYCIKNKNSPTNVHAVVVYGGERTIFTYHEKRNYKLYEWETPKWIFYSSLAKGFEPFQKELVEYIKKSALSSTDKKNGKIGVAFNPGTLQLKSGLENLKNILSVTDILFVNKDEAGMLLGMKNADTNSRKNDMLKLHKELRNFGPKLTVITDGVNGSTSYDGKELVKMGIYGNGKNVVDKTGAGDAYTAGFLAAIFYGKPLKTAMAWGAVNAANNVKTPGGITGLLNKEEIEKLSRDLL